MKRDAVIAAAKDIIPDLDYLLGPTAESVSEALRDLLARAAEDRTVADDIVTLTATYESTRLAIGRRVKRTMSITRGGADYTQLPGTGTPIPLPRFRCSVQGCRKESARVRGEPVPRCATHGGAMVPVS